MNRALTTDLELLEQIARQIREAAASHDWDILDDRLRQRVPVLERIGRGMPETQGDPSAEGEAKRRLAGILAIDRDTERLLEVGRKTLEEQLELVSTGTRGLAGYGNGRGTQSKRIDERG